MPGSAFSLSLIHETDPTSLCKHDGVRRKVFHPRYASKVWEICLTEHGIPIAADAAEGDFIQEVISATAAYSRKVRVDFSNISSSEALRCESPWSYTYRMAVS